MRRTFFPLTFTMSLSMFVNQVYFATFASVGVACQQVKAALYGQLRMDCSLGLVSLLTRHTRNSLNTMYIFCHKMNVFCIMYQSILYAFSTKDVNNYF